MGALGPLPIVDSSLARAEPLKPGLGTLPRDLPTKPKSSVMAGAQLLTRRGHVFMRSCRVNERAPLV